MLQGRHLLGGSFFCNQNVADLRQPDFILTTIARDLASRLPAFRERLATAIRNDADSRAHYSPLEQLLQLICTPLLALGPGSIPSLVIVIDGLDECGDQVTRKDFLRALVDGVPSLPPQVKLFISSRREVDIRRSLEDDLHALHLDLSPQLAEHYADIQKYLEIRMPEVARNCDLPSTWPGKEDISALSSRAAGLFLWITTVCTALEHDPQPEEYLRLILSGEVDEEGDPEKSIDNLYKSVLDRTFRRWDAKISAQFQTIVGGIVAAREPLGISALEILTGAKGTARLLKLLGSVVSFREELSHGVQRSVVLVHPSFSRFLTTRHTDLNPRYRIYLSDSNTMLAAQALHIMLKELRYNICQLETSGKLNEDLVDINTRIGDHIPEYLRYACRFWASHVVDSDVSKNHEIFSLVRNLFFEHILHWIEIMSLLGDVASALRSVQRCEAWVQVRY